MSSYISEELRSLVAIRATHLCEYCLVHEENTTYGCQVDHIISLKHGGTTVLENLAYACVFCNRHKGSDIGSILWSTQEFIRFFNPLTDKWADHFKLDGAIIRPLTEIGKATAQILGFNNIDRILELQTLIAVGRYPTISAKVRMKK
ncbi:HNH endonuclease [candidate division KSB1 bacterium]|nr:HNH endonuclease [candidate division KSB1 bacterium]